MTVSTHQQDALPSGRERAIETLIDMDSQGALYRATRAMDEGVPRALSSRPNLITRSALVEQAHALATHEIDSVAKYEAAFGRVELNKAGSATNEAKKDRILRHYRKMLKVRDQSAPANPAPLLENLFVLFGESKLSKQVIKAVSSHTIYKANSSNIENVEDELASLECMMANLVEQKEPDLQAMLIATLSILTGSILEKGVDDEPKLGKGEAFQKPLSKKPEVVDDMPGLTVGSILSLLDPLDETLGPFCIEPKILEYLGEAAAAYEERIEFQKSRLQKSPVVPVTEAVAETEASGSSSSAFDRILSVVTNGDDGDLSVDGALQIAQAAVDSSESDDSDFEEPQVEQEDSSDSDSDEEGDIMEDDDMLRQALALSLADHGFEDEDSEDEREEEVVQPQMPELEEAGSKDLPESEDYEADLPALPEPLKQYPYSILREGENDDAACYVDPSDLSNFGYIPASHAMVHTLRHALSIILLECASSSSTSQERPSIPGGMGFSLFMPQPEEAKTKVDDSAASAISIPLLVANLVVISENRNLAIDGLKQVVFEEQQYVEAKEQPLSEEEDDPLASGAVGVASVASLTESLETKGMTRKAAAAAHDAANRLKSLRKKIVAWKDRVKLYSHCTLMSLRCLKYFFHGVVSNWLQNGGLTAAEIHEFLPSIVWSKLNISLSSLMSVQLIRSFTTLTTGDDANELERLLMPLRIYKEAVAVWAECVPCVYPSKVARSELLRSLLVECFEGVSAAVAIDALSTLPSTETEAHIHRLNVLCKRLCVSDLMDDFVDHPIPFTVEDQDDEKQDKRDPVRASPLLNLLSSACEALDNVCYLESFHLALCHRMNLRGLLWDGMYTISQDETEDAVCSSPSSTASAAEAFRVAQTPSNSLVFDSLKCSDSIAILSNQGQGDVSSSVNGSSAHQRASKVWGTVLSSSHFNPKSGTHRWGVRLDKCERGHVFVGVATAQASTRTYVGGDKNGWGVIGTQALWHDRRKIRGDYGATFRTGSTIIITLDTDAGTLSFSTWKDSTGPSSAFSLDPLLPSPRRQGQSTGGTIEEWGVAFEGLPLDSKLYPAVGLYQRDDRVTLLHVESGSRSLGRDGLVDEVFVGGSCYYPHRLDESKGNDRLLDRMESVKRHNDIFSQDTLQYAVDVLSHCVETSTKPQEIFISDILPSVAASICLLPSSIPVLSQRFALALLPHVTKCIGGFETSQEDPDIFKKGFREGKWIIRATGSSGSSSSVDCEEYVVDLTSFSDDDDTAIGFQGCGVGTTGKSKNGLVKITGAIYGSSVHFGEEWTDVSDESDSFTDDAASSCLVSARLSLSGTKFEGTYRNIQYGTSGHIAGVRASSNPDESGSNALLSRALLCLAHGHLVSIVSEDCAGDLDSQVHSNTPPDVSEIVWVQRRTMLEGYLSSSLISYGLIDDAGTHLRQEIRELKEFYAYRDLLCEKNQKSDAIYPLLLDSDPFADKSGGRADARSFLLTRVRALDEEMAASNGGKGSLAIICPVEYLNARHHFIACCLHHTELDEDVNIHVEHLRVVWKTALKTMEDGIRAALVVDDSKSRKQRGLVFCENTINASKFLMEIEPNPEKSSRSSGKILNEIASFCSDVTCKSDFDFLKSKMRVAIRRSYLRRLSLHQVTSLLKLSGNVSCGRRAQIVTVDCVVSSIPRLLGRAFNSVSRTKKGGPTEKDLAEANDLGTYFLCGLSGGGLATLIGIRECVHGLLRELVLAAKGIPANSCDASSESLLLSILSCFMLSLRPMDIGAIAEESGILTVLPSLLGGHRSALALANSARNQTSEYSRVVTLHEVAKDDVARAVLKAAATAMHIFLFQVAQQENNPACVAGSKWCEVILLEEIRGTIPLIEVNIKTNMLTYEEQQGEEQYLKWLGASLQEKALNSFNSLIKKRRINRKASSFVLSTFLQSGTFASPFMSQTKPPRSLKSSISPTSSISVPFSSRADDLLSLMGAPAQQYISHLLHMLSCLLNSPMMPFLFSESTWKGVLLGAAGLPSFDKFARGARSSVQLLPGRYRARILRLCVPLLSRSKPNVDIIQDLFVLTGGSSPMMSRNLDDDDALVSRESLSLLRSLHAKPLLWRSAIEGVIQTKLDADEISLSPDDPLITGIVLFVSGKIETIRQGSHVLLKPSAAALLAPDVHSSPGSKSHGNAALSSTSVSNAIAPHHVVGNGTEGIVSGLCRMDASAGIVSTVDMQTGICEVILLERQRDEQKKDIAVSPLEQFKGSRGSNRSRHALTVRALRTPLAVVAQAEEMPLYLDESFPTNGFFAKLLPAAIRNVHPSMKSNIDQGATSPTQHTGFCSPSDGLSLLVLRACIVLLSDDRILAGFLEKKSSRTTLSELLRVASKERGVMNGTKPPQPEFLSSLPLHEAKFSHITAMVHEINVRKSLLSRTADSIWSRRHEEFVSLGGKDSESMDITTEPQKADNSVSLLEVVPTPPVDETTPGSIGFRINTAASGRAVSQSSFGTNSTEEEEDSEAAATAAAHLREAAVAQMAELGLPRAWSELALRRTGGTNIEAAVHFCLERGGDMERLLAEERERELVLQSQSSDSISRRRSGRSDSSSSNQLLRQLVEMGFPSRWCTEALAATRNNVDEALTWILANGERLSAEDEGMEEEASDAEEDLDDSIEEDSGDDDDIEEIEGAMMLGERSSSPLQGEEEKVDDTASRASEVAQTTDESAYPMNTPQQEDVPIAPKESGDNVPVGNSSFSDGWAGSVTPLRFISGRSIINPLTLAVSGLPTGGFSSVGTKGVLLTSGKWYYEAILETAGCLQIGWADGSFSGHCHADRGDGCGDGPSSWAYDGWRRYRWHASATEWGCRWKEGDVVGCLVDMDQHRVYFTLNGRGEEIGMGEAFSGYGFRPCGGVYACVSFNRREKLRLILGGQGTESFRYPLPPGYKGVGEAVQSATKEREELVGKEAVLDSRTDDAPDKCNRFICDLSDGEHGHELFAWQHRYYGADASVHLGSGRSPRLSGATPKSLSANAANGELCAVASVSRRLEKVWSNSKLAGEPAEENFNFAKSAMVDAYDTVTRSLCSTLSDVNLSLGSLYSRKLVLQLLVVLGEKFDLNLFVPHHTGAVLECQELVTALRLWDVLDACVSLRAAGWVGEAGAMAIAAEALGLGISSNDHQKGRHFASLDRQSPGSLSNADEALLVPVAGLTQLLSTVVFAKDCSFSASMRDTGRSLAASAEAAIGGDGGGGPLVFLQRGLQGAASKSHSFCEVIVAVVRRSVRQLAVIEYCGDDSAQSESAEDDEIDNSIGTFDKGKNDDHDKSLQPDARLTSFLSGLLLSDPVLISQQNRACLMESLFEAWSVGLLSASAPWRMVCALTASGILNMAPTALIGAVNSVPALQRYYSRLPATVARRVWAERAAVPVCSRYVQSLVELLASVRSALAVSQPSTSFLRVWKTVEVDAAMPIPFGDSSSLSFDKSNRESTRTATDFSNWEWANGWLSNDSGWEVWTGCAEFVVVDWKSPSRSAVRTLMDGGEGPPMLREGCTVMRGLDWGDGDEDGKSEYETEKGERESEREKKAHDQAVDEADPADPHQPVTDDDQDPVADSASQDSIAHVDNGEATAESDGKEQAESQCDARPSLAKKKKRKKVPNPKLPTGTVLSVEEWNGIPAMGRRVRWDRTGKEGIYRYGGDGGRYDICHVDVNDKFTRVRKRHPVPESAEQCASRHGFGAGKKYSMLLRLRVTEQVFDIMAKSTCREGILEWPDFGAGVRVNCILNTDGSVTIEEKELLYGSKDSGWEARFGQPSYVPNTTIVLSSSASSVSAQYQAEMDTKSSFLSMYEELLGSSSHLVHLLRNRTDGGRVRVTTEMQLLRGRRSSKDRVAFDPPGCPPPLRFDRDFHAASMSLSRDGRTATCVSSEGRGTAFASTGFTKGLHYWEVKLEQADIGSVFIGVAEKPSGSGSGSSFGNDSPPRLNRWLGWGFVNFRATYASGAERVYGAHCHNDDTVGVLLDCDAGRVSFFYDGLKYGEHILNDLGCAFENISPFGFNADGCGSGGAGQGAPSAVEGARTGRYPAHGAVRPRALWPVIGLRNPGDRVTFSTKWMTSLGVDSSSTLRNALAVDEVLSSYDLESHSLPQWFVAESFQEFKRWESGRWYRTETRATGPHRLAGFGLDVEVDASPIACAAASAGLGLRRALLHGDRVVVKRSAGRILELSEEAIILGAYQGRLYYRIVSQKSEGGSLTEGGGRAWFWDESEAVNDSLQLVGPGRGLEIDLPLIDRFTCLSTGGLRIVYKGGAVVRSDVEIFDRSQNIGVIGYGTVIPQQDVLERRVNSCGVVRYRIRYEGLGEGWISSRIRGGKEEPIVEPVHDDVIEKEQKSRFPTPMHAARAWYETYKKSSSNVTGLRRDLPLHGDEFSIKDLSEFEELVSCLSPGSTSAQLDKVVASLVGVIADFSESGDAVECSFTETTTVVSYAIASSENKRLESENGGNPGANEAAAAILACQNIILSPKMIIARMAILRAFNRRIRLALPWLSVRPSQEGTAILGGLCGHGASPERAGRQKLSTSMDLWVQVPSIASRIRTHRGLIFGSVKRMLLDSITFATTTPTPLSHDEYELPREIRTVRVNRLKARRAMASSDSLIKRKHSVFSQLQNETRSWGGAALRRGFVAKGHGGQKRAFKVKLVGEGVNDYSGPYREVFTDALREVLEVGENGYGVLGVLDPTPNKASQLGENRDLHMFSRSENDLSLEEGWRSEEELRIKRSFSILTTSRDESSREVAEALAFLGRLVGTACRHGIPVELPLSMNSVWKPIVEENTEEVESLREIDLLASRQYMSSPLDCPPLLWWQRRMLNSFVDGLSNVLPVEILTLLSGEELQDIICGNPDVDVDLLRRVVEYEGYEESDSVISFFWEALREMTTDERKKFLQFVWARNRLPNKESDFEAPFKIMRGSEKMSDETLPSASTCFFSLTLPCYSSKDILKRKLLFAIENVCTMESDYVTNDAEVGEGWRGL